MRIEQTILERKIELLQKLQIGDVVTIPGSHQEWIVASEVSGLGAYSKRTLVRTSEISVHDVDKYAIRVRS